MQGSLNLYHLNMLRLVQLLLILFSLLLNSCARLPDYALPHIEETKSNQLSFKQGFTYRKLTVNDFRAPSLPEHMSEHAKHFNARSRIQIRPSTESQFIINSSYNEYYDQIIWSGRIQSIVFEAVMLPDYSWWNPAVSREKIAYVLQHEQIHFALMELAARHLTQQAQADIDAMHVIDSTRQGVHDQLLEKVKELIQAEHDEIIKEHTAFDEDTSLYNDPEKQQWWFDRVNNQLRDTTY